MGDVELKELKVIISAETSQLKQGMKEMKSQVSGATKATKKLGTTFKQIFSGLGIALGAVAIGKFIKSCMSAVSEVSKLTGSVEQLNKWSEATAKLKTQWTTLKAQIGIVLTKFLLPIVNALNSLLTRLNKAFGIIGGINSEVKQTQSTMAGFDQINTLNSGNETGTDALEEVEEALKLMEATESGKILSTKLVNNIKTTLTEKLPQIGTTINEKLTKVLEDNDIQKIAYQLGEMMGSVIAGGLKFVFNAIGLSKYIKEELGKLENDASMFDKITAVVIGIVEWIKKVFTELFLALDSFIEGLVRSLLEGMFGKQDWIDKFFEGDAKEFYKQAPRNYAGRDIPGYASGGVVYKPTLAMVGEKGKEYITPADSLESLFNQQLNYMQSILSNNNNNINIKVDLDGQQVGQSVVNYHNNIVRKTGRSPLLA